MLRCASSLVVAAYAKIRLTPRDLRALPADFLRSRLGFRDVEWYSLYIGIPSLYIGRRAKDGCSERDPDLDRGDKACHNADECAAPEFRRI